jgi:hypothetical protein
LLILMAEAILGLLILALVLFFNYRKKVTREMNEIDSFITQLDEEIELKNKPLNQLLSQTCKLDRHTVDKTLTEVSEAERSLLHSVIRLFMQREMSLLSDLNENIGNLSQPYYDIIKKVASQSPKTETTESSSGLEHINQQLVRQLETAMQTIDEITAEYTRVFSGNQTELELENSRKKMLKVFAETEHALLHPENK